LRRNDGCSSCILTTTVPEKLSDVNKLRYFPTNFLHFLENYRQTS
jgi:hypothetical protein